MLSGEFHVRKYQFKPSKGLIKTSLNLLKQFLYLTVAIWRYDAVYIWFADFHSLLPVAFARCFGKKSFVVIGGYDVCRLKKFGYGVFTSKLRGCFALNTMKLCTLNLTVSEHVDRKVKYICANAEKELIFNCVNLRPEKEIPKKEPVILTVALLNTERTFYLKGIGLFIEVARLVPEYEFIIVGFNHSRLSHLLGNKPANLKTVEKVPHEELNGWYARARFYCQFSMFESFGVSIAEAMNYGCIPLVTNGGAMPEVVGNSKYIVPLYKTAIADIIRDLNITETDEDLQALRDRIKSVFSRQNREIKLFSVLNKYLQRK